MVEESKETMTATKIMEWLVVNTDVGSWDASVWSETQSAILTVLEGRKPEKDVA